MYPADADESTRGWSLEPDSPRRGLVDRLILAQLALDSVGEGVLVHTFDGILRFFNPAAAWLYGYSMDALECVEPWGWIAEWTTEQREVWLAELKSQGAANHTIERAVWGGHKRILEVHSRLVDSQHGVLVVCVTHDVTERVEGERALQHAVRHDPLTNLGNRVLLEECLEQAVASARRHGDCVGIAYVDLDDFKVVNDRWGHAVGDETLVVVARRLQAAVRAEDTLARVGGDEFVVVLPRLASPAVLGSIESKLRKAVEEQISLPEAEVCIRASIGVALFDETDSAWTFIERADAAMYRAKRSSRAMRGREGRRDSEGRS